MPLAEMQQVCQAELLQPDVYGVWMSAEVCHAFCPGQLDGMPCNIPGTSPTIVYVLPECLWIGPQELLARGICWIQRGSLGRSGLLPGVLFLLGSRKP